ncbi:MAG: hypothetical protein IPN67_11280 [Bacteroidales bacterium]|nr:hypothetical protein [Bacteroidales bacterium]
MFQKLKFFKHNAGIEGTKNILSPESICDPCVKGISHFRLKRNSLGSAAAIILEFFLLINLQAIPGTGKDPVIIDTSHYSTTFGEIRNYRIFLPPDYYLKPQKRYPVIYFFHGWSQRYFGPVGDDYSNYDKGEDNNGDNIANYVSLHDVIVVKPDGFNPLSDSAYELMPYNECYVTTFRQFPIYFPEIVNQIDNSFRTLDDREHRAVCGLSMGGYMSYWVAGKYPDMVSAAGNFCGSSEFMAGPMTIPVEYRILDMYSNYSGVNLRFNYGERDNLRFFHFDMNRIWKEVVDNYEFKAYKAAHSTCGLGDMFDFCIHTFENPPAKPSKWDHIDLYPEFSVWNYHVSSDRFRPGFTILENVDKRGFRSSVREFLPDGETMSYVSLTVTTPPLYEKNTDYLIIDSEPFYGKVTQKTIRSDNNGRLKISLNGGLHNIGINSLQDDSNLTIASVRVNGMNWAKSRKEVVLSVSLLNKGQRTAHNVKANLSSLKKYVEVRKGESDFGNIDVKSTAASVRPFSFYIKSDSIEIARFKLTISDGKNGEWSEFFEIPVKADLPEFRDFVIADGKTFSVAKAGILTESLFLGSGNGDGVANPGESIVILVKDNNIYRRTNLYTSDEFVNKDGINVRITDFWNQFGGIGSSPKYSLPLISDWCPDKHPIEFFAEYWIAENKFHIIKKGKVKITVTGKDKTPPVIDWAAISGSNRLQVKAYDGGNIVSVRAKLIPVNNVKGLDNVTMTDPDKVIEFELNDEGRDGDVTSDDKVFSKKISPPATFFYHVEVEAIDQYGYKTIFKGFDTFLVYSD